jgi:phosphoribosylanthranilate isomerase
MAAEKIFRIKICGITSVHDATIVAEAGADAIGLNFWPASRRYVGRNAASEIAAAAAGNLITVGVFVNATADDIARTADEVELDWIQLHGDESPEVLAQLPSEPRLIRAFRCGAGGLIEANRYLTECGTCGRLPNAILIDSDAGPVYGGTGHVANWAQVRDERDLLAGIPTILAGGLTPENVADAIAAVWPEGVDVASGVEREPGSKDAKLVREFVAAARAAYARF